jgi:WD40 repeat protein
MVAGFSPDNRSIVVGWTDRADVQDITGSDTSFSIEVPSSVRTYRPWYSLRGYRLIENRLDLLSTDPVTYIRVFDIRTARMMYANTFAGAIQSESITEDGQFCLGFRYGWIDVWDMEHHELTASLATDREYYGYAGGSNRIAIAKRRIVISREESVACLIDPVSTEPARTIPAGQPVRDILITPDGKGLLTMGNRAVKYWDLSSGRCLREFSIAEIEIWDDLPPGAPMMAITPDGKSLMLPSEGGVAIRDLSTGRDERGFSPGGRPGPFALYVTADGKRLTAVSGSTGFLASYDLETGASVAGFPLNVTEPFQAFCVGDRLLATATRWSLSVWDAQTGRLLLTREHKFYIEDILLAPSQREVIVSGLNGFYFWDRENGEAMIEKPDNIDGVVTFGGCTSFLPGGGRFFVRGRHYIALWDVDTRQLLWRHDRPEENRIRKIAAFPDGERFAVMDTTGVIQVRSVATGEVLASLHVLPGGFVWETPPDDHAPSGWLWTDREDLVSVSGDDYNAKTFRHRDCEHKAYLKIYNNPKMVMARVEGRESYERQVELHARVLDTARIGNASGRRPAALTAGKKGDRK